MTVFRVLLLLLCMTEHRMVRNDHDYLQHSRPHECRVALSDNHVWRPLIHSLPFPNFGPHTISRSTIRVLLTGASSFSESINYCGFKSRPWSIVSKRHSLGINSGAERVLKLQQLKGKSHFNRITSSPNRKSVLVCGISVETFNWHDWLYKDRRRRRW